MNLYSLINLEATMLESLDNLSDMHDAYLAFRYDILPQLGWSKEQYEAELFAYVNANWGTVQKGLN
jgi:hypothetical protein